MAKEHSTVSSFFQFKAFHTLDLGKIVIDDLCNAWHLVNTRPGQNYSKNVICISAASNDIGGK